MKTVGHKTIMEIGDRYEFCIINTKGISQVLFGEVASLNFETKTFNFIRLNNGREKKPTGEEYKNLSIRQIRHVGMLHDDTWSKGIQI